MSGDSEYVPSDSETDSDSGSENGTKQKREPEKKKNMNRKEVPQSGQVVLVGGSLEMSQNYPVQNCETRSRKRKKKKEDDPNNRRKKHNRSERERRTRNRNWNEDSFKVCIGHIQDAQKHRDRIESSDLVTLDELRQSLEVGKMAIGDRSHFVNRTLRFIRPYLWLFRSPSTSTTTSSQPPEAIVIPLSPPPPPQPEMIGPTEDVSQYLSDYEMLLAKATIYSSEGLILNANRRFCSLLNLIVNNQKEYREKSIFHYLELSESQKLYLKKELEEVVKKRISKCLLSSFSFPRRGFEGNCTLKTKIYVLPGNVAMSVVEIEFFLQEMRSGFDKEPLPLKSLTAPPALPFLPLSLSQ